MKVDGKKIGILLDTSASMTDENVEDILKEGETIEVKLIAIDERSGKLKLSRKVLLPKPEKTNK